VPPRPSEGQAGERRRLVFVSPHQARAQSLFQTRPSALLHQFVQSGGYDAVTIVNRLRPDVAARVFAAGRKDGTRLVRFGAWVGLRTVLASGTDSAEPPATRASPTLTLIEHPWPSGPAESAFLARVVAGAMAAGPVTVWVADPMAARVLGSLHPKAGLTTAFDGYDAWDLSPLIRGRYRRGAVRRGYAAAARGADVVFANTASMLERLAQLGARRCVLLPNACAEVEPGIPAAEPYVAYVGRIHERFDTGLAFAVAGALEAGCPEAWTLRIAGPVERPPADWARLADHPRVRLLGALPFSQARAFIAGSRALVIPHTPTEYTRSQDALKAWDALAAGVPVISTSVPPADAWPPGLALIADEPKTFADAAIAALEGKLESGRRARLDYALQNRWQDRARHAREVLEGFASKNPS
jgi:glycosyltransferase involved in cell wall biosynthesis